MLDSQNVWLHEILEKAKLIYGSGLIIFDSLGVGRLSGKETKETFLGNESVPYLNSSSGYTVDRVFLLSS